MGDEEGDQTKLHEEMYHLIWAKAKINTKSQPSMNLNKELRRAVTNFTIEEKAECVERIIAFEIKLYKETDYPLSNTVIERKTQWYMQRQLSTEFTREHDSKWRHPAHKWSFFFRFMPTISKILNKNPKLKAHILGEEHENFEFSELWMESRTEFMNLLARTITECEKQENIEYRSIWDLAEEIRMYALGAGDFTPLRDAYRW